MKRMIFHDFYQQSESKRLVPFIVMSSTFHFILFLLIVSGFFVHLAPPVASYQQSRLEHVPLFNINGKNVVQQRDMNRGFNNQAAPEMVKSQGSSAGIRGRKLSAGSVRSMASSQAWGRVYNRRSRFVKGAVVRAIHMTTRQIHMTVTDEKGKYQFTSLKPGAYDIRVSWEGLPIPIRKQLIIHPGQIYRHKWSDEGLNRSTYKSVTPTPRESAPIYIGNIDSVARIKEQVPAIKEQLESATTRQNPKNTTIPMTPDTRTEMPQLKRMFVHQHTMETINTLYFCFQSLHSLITEIIPILRFLF